MQQGLFQIRAPSPPLEQISSVPFLQWIPDESLFSLCSRLHVFWGDAQYWRTAERLFGGRNVGTHHDLPSGLEAFSIRTRGMYGDAIELATQRTVLRYYLPFMTEATASYVVKTLSGQLIPHLKFKMGLLTSRFRANHPLKACPQCMQEDVISHGWAVWRLNHQYPGVWACLTHGQLLQVCQFKSTSVERFLWRLPDLRDLAPVVDCCSSELHLKLTNLARFIFEALDAGNGQSRFTTLGIQGAIRQEIQEKGWLTSGGRVRMTQVATDYLEYCTGLGRIDELSQLPNSIDAAETQVARLLRPMRSGTHPLRLLLAMNWLYGTYDRYKFLVDHQVLRNHPAAAIAPDQSRSRGGKRQRFMALIRGPQSLSTAARMIGISVTTAVEWAEQEGIPVKRRPKHLTASVKKKIEASLRSGTDKQVIADKWGISLVSVSRILRTNAPLLQKWREVRWLSLRAQQRNQWSQLLARYPNAEVKALRKKMAGVYMWLYRHDRSWLSENLPIVTTNKRPKTRPLWPDDNNPKIPTIRSAKKT